jgi:flagella basal body P-ring formation protein FlgA
MSRNIRTIVRRLLSLALFALAPHVAFAESESAASFPVPTVTIRAGDVLNEVLIVERRLIANGIALRTHYTSRDEVIGKVARRPLAAGAAIPVNALREPYAFKEGQRVVVEFVSGGLKIRGMALALQPGIVGSMVRASNLDTGVGVNGVVQADGRIEIGG